VNGLIYHLAWIIHKKIAMFLPSLTASALLQGIRGEGPQLHALRLASAAISACSSSRLENRFLAAS
jgi:hypothetical protein